MTFGYTIFYVRDVAATVAFYERAFGVGRRFVHDSGQYAELETGATTLAFASHGLARGNGMPFTAGGTPAVEIGFVTGDVAAAFEKAVAAGAEPLVAPARKPWGQTVAYVRDADGFLVELCTPVGPPAFSVRPITPADTPALVAVSGGSGLFKPDELDAVRAMFDEYHAGPASGRRALAYDEGGTLAGVAYFGPKEFADRVWELLLIAVDGPRQGQGVGSRLLEATEAAAREAGGRLLMVETSSRAGFERTRRFYRRHGYAEVACVPDFFSDGDGKVTFTKRVAGPA